MKTKLFFLLLGLTAMIGSAQVHGDYWQDQATGFAAASRGINHISIVDENVVWVNAYDGSGGGATIQEFSKTSDGGATWTPGVFNISSPGSGIAMVHGMDANTAYMVAFPNAGGDAQGIYKTTDGGTTWDRQNTALYSDPVAFANVVYFWDANKGFCQGDPVDGYYELYTTDDGGANWTRVPSGDIPAPLTGEYGYTSQIFVTGDALWWTTNFGRIYRSYDFGHTFEVFQSPLSDFGGAAESGEVSFSDDNNGYLINQDGTFWTSNDGGATWNLEFPNTGLVFGSSVFAIPGTDAVVSAGSGTITGSSFSTNKGLDWTIMCDDQHLTTRFLDGATGWSGGFNVDATTGGIFKYIGDPIGIGVEELEGKGFSAYPNPVQNVLNMSANENITSVSVYNMLGQEVYNNSINASNYTIDTSNFANGTYIVEVTIGAAVGSIKIVK